MGSSILLLLIFVSFAFSIVLGFFISKISRISYYNVDAERPLGKIKNYIYNLLGSNFKSTVCFEIKKVNKNG
jgi:hypothetical protein